MSVGNRVMQSVCRLCDGDDEDEVEEKLEGRCGAVSLMGRASLHRVCGSYSTTVQIMRMHSDRETINNAVGASAAG
jgi:hypothetical protein